MHIDMSDLTSPSLMEPSSGLRLSNRGCSAICHHMQDSVKADLARLLYMKHFGGCYVDLDVESIKPLDELLKDESIVLARMGDAVLAHDVPNAFFCSAAGHPFWVVLSHPTTSCNAWVWTSLVPSCTLPFHVGSTFAMYMRATSSFICIISEPW